VSRTRLGVWLWIITRVSIEYRCAHRRLLALLRLRRFTEKIQ
jgi:hypothetical protein